MSIQFNVNSGNWNYNFYEGDDGIGRISIEPKTAESGIQMEQGIESNHSLYEPVKNLLQCIMELDRAQYEFIEQTTLIVQTEEQD